MNATTRIDVPERLHALVTLGRLLEWVERSPAPVAADQYRAIVEHLKTELGAVDQDEVFKQLLAAFPAMAELYENLHYQHAGLCLNPLATSLDAELQAKALLTRVARLSRP